MFDVEISYIIMKKHQKACKTSTKLVGNLPEADEIVGFLNKTGNVGKSFSQAIFCYKSLPTMFLHLALEDGLIDGMSFAYQSYMNYKKALLPVVCSLFVLTLSVSASTVPTLTLTEVSSTQLNWAWSTGGSGTLTDISPDVWQDTTFSGPTLTGPDSLHYGWIEPDNSSEFNNVLISSDGSSVFTLYVSSDVTSGDVTKVVNGTVKGSGNGYFAVVYDDLGDSTSAPDGVTHFCSFHSRAAH